MRRSSEPFAGLWRSLLANGIQVYKLSKPRAVRKNMESP